MNRRIRNKKAKQLYESAAHKLTASAMLNSAIDAVTPRGPIMEAAVVRGRERAARYQAQAARDAAVALSLTQRRRHG